MKASGATCKSSRLQNRRSVGVEPLVIDESQLRLRLAAEENVFCDRQVRNQVQLLKDNADAGGLGGARIRKAYLVPIDAGACRRRAGKRPR